MVFVARRCVLRERKLISKEDSGSTIDLEEILESISDEPPKSNGEGTLVDTSTQPEAKTVVESDDKSLPFRRTSSRVCYPPKFYDFHITSDKLTIGDTQVDLDELVNYKEALAGPVAAEWKRQWIARSNP